MGAVLNAGNAAPAVIGCLAGLLLCGCTADNTGTENGAAGHNNMKLWYRRPAESWNEAMPMGNGRLGAMVFGTVATERLQLNEDTLWSGGPTNWNNPNARELLPQLRQLIVEGRYAQADELSRNMQGPYNQSYMPMGNLYLDFGDVEEVSDYSRELDIDRAVATVCYEAGGVKYVREVFASYPDGVIVVRLTSSKPGRISFAARLESQLRHSVESASRDRLILKGKCPAHVEPEYRWQIKDKDAVIYDENEPGEGMRFEIHARAIVEKGKLAAEADKMVVSGADAVTIIISAATSFNGFDKSPGLAGKNPAKDVVARLDSAAGQPYSQLLKRHIRDYQPIFRRVSLDLGKADADLPTDERIRNFRRGGDPQLMMLLYQFGRYLMISSSRPGTQPANLKGIWNDRIRPEFSSNWTLDLDAEMNYWFVEAANLAEMHEPFLDFIADLAVNGRQTAMINYGCRGWCAHHNADIWRQSGPAGDWGEGNPHWASWAMAGAWLSQHLWEHYAFSGDKDYLRNRAWPLMKGAAMFCLDWLVEDANGKLVTIPSVSPENTFVLPDGSSAQMSIASTMDMTLIYELFSNCIVTCEALGIDDDFRRQLIDARDRLLYPPRIGAQGQLQEWSNDWPGTDPQHRHLSHLYGVFPGREISPLRTESFAEAAKKSLILRGAGDVCWSYSWKAACWARLGDGNRAAEMLGLLLSPAVMPDRAGRGRKDGVYPNMISAYPPFVLINGNFCAAAAINEMLLQSQLNELHLLPALPSEWPTGNVKGLRARGGFTVDIDWKDGRFHSARISSQSGNVCKVRAGTAVAVTAGGRPVELRAIDGLAEFQTRPNESYVIAAAPK